MLLQQKCQVQTANEIATVLAEKHCSGCKNVKFRLLMNCCERKTLFRLNCCERKTLLRLKKEAEQAGFCDQPNGTKKCCEKKGYIKSDLQLYGQRLMIFSVTKKEKFCFIPWVLMPTSTPRFVCEAAHQTIRMNV